MLSFCVIPSPLMEEGQDGGANQNPGWNGEGMHVLPNPFLFWLLNSDY